MGTKSHERRSDAVDVEARERLTDLYATVNHAMAGRGRTAAVATLLSDDVTWIEATTDDRAERTLRGADAVVERLFEPADAVDHLQLLPESFTETSAGVAVAGAYVGTVDGRAFEVPFEHVHALERGAVRRWTVETGPALEEVVDA